MTTTKTFDMQFIRYMNIFNRVTRVSAKHCFFYNNTVVFVVPKAMIMNAIGRDNSNLRQLSEIIAKRIRVVPEPKGEEDLQRFIEVLVDPIKFDKIEIVRNPDGFNEAVISTPGRESKAMLIGRGRARETELKDILEQYFGVKNLKIL